MQTKKLLIVLALIASVHSPFSYAAESESSSFGNGDSIVISRIENKMEALLKRDGESGIRWYTEGIRMDVAILNEQAVQPFFDKISEGLRKMKVNKESQQNQKGLLKRKIEVAEFTIGELKNRLDRIESRSPKKSKKVTRKSEKD